MDLQFTWKLQKNFLQSVLLKEIHSRTLSRSTDRGWTGGSEVPAG